MVVPWMFIVTGLSTLMAILFLPVGAVRLVNVQFVMFTVAAVDWLPPMIQAGFECCAINFHMSLEGTDLAELWRQGRVPVMDLETYARLLGRCLQVLPPETVVHRLTGDGAKKDLLAPLWTADKKHVLNYVNQYLRGL